jgi:thioredoxin 1
MLEVKKFYGTWCGPCRMLSPVIEKLKTQHTDVVFKDINVDEDYELASQYSVRSIPLVVLEKDGKEVQRFTGLQSELAYQNAINELKTA